MSFKLVLAPTDLQLETTTPTYSEEEELRGNYRGPYSSDTGHPSVKVTPTDVEERHLSYDFNDRMISTLGNRSWSPGPSVVRDDGELRPQTSDQLSHSWWSEENHVVKSKKTERTDALQTLQSTRKVSNNLIPRWEEWKTMRYRNILVA